MVTRVLTTRLLVLVALLTFPLLLVLAPPLEAAKTGKEERRSPPTASRSAAIQTDDVRMQVSPFLDGVVRYGEWLPLRVRVENDGAPFHARVVVSLSRQAGGHIRVAYWRGLELPRGARKEITLYVLPNTFTRRLAVDLVPAGETDPRLSQKVTVSPTRPTVYTVAVARGKGDGLNVLTGLNLDQQEVRVLDVSLADLPERAEGWGSLDALVLSGVDTGTLTPAQQEALTTWVYRGGALVLGGGPDAARVLAGLPEPLRPVQPAGDITLDALPALENLAGEPIRVSGPFVLADSEVREGSGVRLWQEDLPLVVERAVHQGLVLWLALDPNLSPFDAWAGADEFWHALLVPIIRPWPNVPEDFMSQENVDNQVGRALYNLPALALPSLGLLAPLLGLYILVVGPANYLFLRRSRRLEWAWLTIPAITIVFSAGAYGLGLRARGTDVIVHQINAVELFPDTNVAFARVYVGLFSPGRRTYNITFPTEVLVTSLTRETNPFGSTTAGSPTTLTVHEGLPTVVENLPVNQWSMQGLVASGTVEVPYRLEAELYTQGDRIVGTVRNASTVPLQNVAVVVGNQVARLGDLTPGQGAEVSLSLQFLGAREPLGFVLFREEMRSGGLRRELDIKRQIVDALLTTPMGKASLTSRSAVWLNEPYLLGWTDSAPVEARVHDVTPTVARTTLVYARLPLRLATESGVSIPAGLLRPNIGEAGGRRFLCYGPRGEGLAPNYTRAEVTFRLPHPALAARLNQLVVHLTQDGTGGLPPRLHVWNERTESWDEVQGSRWGTKPIPARDHVSSSGEVRLQLVNTSEMRGGCVYVGLSARGE